MKTKMINRIKKLESLSTNELIEGSKVFVLNERKNTAGLIAYIAELRSRKTFLDLGYRSIYQFCTEGLGLEEGPSYLRMQVARVSKEFPLILEKIELGELSLTAASRLSPILNSKNIDQVLKDCSGKTVQKVDEYIAALRPRKDCGSGVRAKSVKNKGDLFGQQPIESDSRSRERAANSCEPIDAKRYNIRFSADGEFKEKLDRLAEVMNIEKADRHLEEILSEALNVALEKRDPAKKEIRRQKRLKSKLKKVEHKETKEDLSRPISSRYIRAEDRARALARSGYRCEKLGTNGHRCSATVHLEVDHVISFALGGSNDLSNLQILCRAHNQHKARHDFGHNFIARKVKNSNTPILK